MSPETVGCNGKNKKNFICPYVLQCAHMYASINNLKKTDVETPVYELAKKTADQILCGNSACKNTMLNIAFADKS